MEGKLKRARRGNSELWCFTGIFSLMSFSTESQPADWVLGTSSLPRCYPSPALTHSPDHTNPTLAAPA